MLNKLPKNSKVEKCKVLTKALFNAALLLDLNIDQIAAVLDLKKNKLIELRENSSLDASSQEGQRAIMLIKVTLKLICITGGDKIFIRHFMNTYNKATQGIPIQQIQELKGLRTLLIFLEAITERAKTHKELTKFVE